MKKRENYKKQFGDHLTSLIKKHGYSSVEAFGLQHEKLSKANLYKIATGKAEPRLGTLLNIADALEIPLSELLSFKRK